MLVVFKTILESRNSTKFMTSIFMIYKEILTVNRKKWYEKLLSSVLPLSPFLGARKDWSYK